MKFQNSSHAYEHPETTFDNFFFFFYYLGPPIPSKPFTLYAAPKNPFVAGEMITSPDGKGVIAILVGAYATDAIEESNTLIELKAGASNWTILRQKLKYARTMPVVMTIPNDLTSCDEP